MVGIKQSQKNFLSSLGKLGTVVEVFTADKLTYTGGRVSGITGLKGTVASQASVTEQPYSRITQGGSKILMTEQLVDANDKYLAVGSNPFSAITNGTVITIYKEDGSDVSKPAFGGLNATAYPHFGASGSSSTIFSTGFGSPSFFLNGASPSWVNRGDVFTSFDAVKNTYVTMSYVGIDFSSQTDFSIAAYRDGAGEMQGEILAIAIFSDALSASDRAAAETLLEAYSTRIAADANDYDAGTEIQVVEDTIGGQNAANTGLSYDQSRGEVIVSAYVQTFDAQIYIYDKDDLVLGNQVATFNVFSKLQNIQGVAYDSDRNVYWVLGGATDAGNNCRGFDRSGNQVYTIQITQGAGSSLCYYDGGLWIYPTGGATQFFKVDPITGLTLETRNLPAIISGISALEGLWVDERGYIVNAGARIYLFNWDDELEDVLATGTDTEAEGVARDESGTIYSNRDEWFHQSEVNGNKIWKFARQ